MGSRLRHAAHRMRGVLPHPSTPLLCMAQPCPKERPWCKSVEGPTAAPDADAPRGIHREAMASAALVLEIVQRCLIERELELERAIRQAALLAQRDRLIHHRDTVHPVSSFPGLGPVCPCAPLHRSIEARGMFKAGQGGGLVWWIVRRSAHGTRQTLTDLIARRRALLQEQAMTLGSELFEAKPRLFVDRLRAYWRAWHGNAAQAIPSEYS